MANATVTEVIVPTGFVFSNLIVGVVVVAVLYLTREILVPIVLAVLLSFVLAPLVRFLQGLKVPRSVAVMSAVTAALAISLSLATMVMVQVNQLGNDLPRYQSTLSDKMHNLRDAVGRAGLLNASSMLKDLDRELKDRGDTPVPGRSLTGGPAGKIPIPVEVHQPDPGASETLVSMLQPLVAPFTTTAVVVIFLIFFLFQREDLRNRFIRLAGSEDLERTTAALDDAGQRLSKLFLTQLMLNAIFGVVIGLGLTIIGVPSAPLWGLLATILRFVPYIGAVLAAALPIALAAAVGSDWTMAIWTIALFAVVEPLTGQIVEPLVCGRTAGLSPVAIVVAASFWTWLWGPLGLLLSTPLTLCLVVLARHVERLQFIDVMLGDQPALTPQQAAYQRMLTGDPLRPSSRRGLF
jgi:predicted PurR-regulated permease PerM